MPGPGLLFVVSGPSGAGKDTLVDALRARMPRVRYSVSSTTRDPRPGEREGEHYFYLQREEFEQRRVVVRATRLFTARGERRAGRNFHAECLAGAL